MAIANLRCLRNRQKAHVSENATRRVRYCTYEQGTEQARGEWYSPEGGATYEAVDAWAREQAHAHTYMYTLVLSVRAGLEVSSADFVDVMNADALFSDWRLIRHADTANQHAHVICFGDKWIAGSTVSDWQQAACARLATLEEQRAEQWEQQRAEQWEQQRAEQWEQQRAVGALKQGLEAESGIVAGQAHGEGLGL